MLGQSWAVASPAPVLTCTLVLPLLCASSSSRRSAVLLRLGLLFSRLSAGDVVGRLEAVLRQERQRQQAELAEDAGSIVATIV